MWLAAPRQIGYQAWESTPIYKIRFKNSPSPVSFRQQRDGSSEAGVHLTFISLIRLTFSHRRVVENSSLN